MKGKIRFNITGPGDELYHAEGVFELDDFELDLETLPRANIEFNGLAILEMVKPFIKILLFGLIFYFIWFKRHIIGDMIKSNTNKAQDATHYIFEKT